MRSFSSNYSIYPYTTMPVKLFFDFKARYQIVLKELRIRSP